MERSDFQIGVEFMTETGRWRCTDVGSRSIAAIRLDLDHDPSWYNGPPYGIVEHVFDEDDFEGLEPAPAEKFFDASGKSRLVTIPMRPRPRSAFDQIVTIDYTVIFVRDMNSMRRFYEDVLQFRLVRELSLNWIEYQIGGNVLALAKPTRTASDEPIPSNTASLQLAFKVPEANVDLCAEELIAKGIVLFSPPTNRSFGHRTLFFRDPDGNLIEIYAEI